MKIVNVYIIEASSSQISLIDQHVLSLELEWHDSGRNIADVIWDYINNKEIASRSNIDKTVLVLIKESELELHEVSSLDLTLSHKSMGLLD